MRRNDEIVVFGGTGFIGRHLVHRLLEQGHTVRAISRQAGQLRSTVPGLTYLSGDVGDDASLQAAVEGASVVFHLATGGGDRWADFERDVIQGTARIAALSQQCGVRRFVYTSSIAALYLGGTQTVTGEAGPDDRPDQRSHYSRSKIATEELLRRMHAEQGLPVVVFRPGLVVGPEGVLTHGGLGGWPSDICCLGWGRGTSPLPFVLAQDVAAALAAAVDAPGIDGMTFNLVGDVRPTAAEFIAILGERSHRRFQFYPQSLVKMQAMEILKWLIKVVARKPENPFPPYRDLKSRSLRAPFDCSSAKQHLGWKPVDRLEDFLREAIDANLESIHPADLRLTPSPATL